MEYALKMFNFVKMIFYDFISVYIIRKNISYFLNIDLIDKSIVILNNDNTIFKTNKLFKKEFGCNPLLHINFHSIKYVNNDEVFVDNIIPIEHNRKLLFISKIEDECIYTNDETNVKTNKWYITNTATENSGMIRANSCSKLQDKIKNIDN
tara:strand:- start:198 stop:650 length:453 start_codon:yes stop_codon:yes gene_type:complete